MRFRVLKIIAMTMMLAFGFVASALDVCLDEPSAPVSQSHHCCIQCCSVRNLGPVGTYAVSIKSTTEMSLGYFPDDTCSQDPFLDGINRPPIA